MRFTVLASGSSGNSSFLTLDGAGVLVDIGLGPRLLASRLAVIGASWRRVQAAVLTHTHGDHVNRRTLGQLRRQNIPLWCHADHHADLDGDDFDRMLAAGLVRSYEIDETFAPVPGLRCRAIPVAHDADPTFAFRFDGPADLFGAAAALGYATDLGCFTDDIAQAFADVDLLALEFNHDERLERASGRPQYLVERVLSDAGHLSNDQAAALLAEIVKLSAPGRLRRLVQLHLSRDCNLPSLAVGAAQAAVRGEDTLEIYTARQDRPGRTLAVGSVCGARS